MLRNRDLIRQIAVWVAVIVTIAFNGLAGGSTALNGQLTGDVANRYLGKNLWLPAGYVFSIWGLIYIGFIAYAIFQSLPSQKTNPRLRRIGWPFVLSCAANILWLIFFQYSSNPDPSQAPNQGLLIASMITMLVLLGALIYIYLALRGGRPRANEFPTADSQKSQESPVSRGERWAVWVPFSIYLGWITVATVANASHVLVASGWLGQPLPAVLWLVIMYAVALVLAVLMTVTQRDVAYLLVLVWAFIGIAVNYSNLTAVLISSIIAALFVAILAILAAARGAWPSKVYAA
jgi:hypothetical protein